MRTFILTSLLLCIIMMFASVAKAGECQAMKNFKSDISLTLQTPPAVFDLSKTIRQMNEGQHERHKEWLKKNGLNPIWASSLETNGRAVGGWGISLQSQMEGKPLGTFGLSWCLYIKQLTLDMMYRTIIEIPKEYPKGSCAYNVIWVHEMKHHKTNVAIVQKAVERFRKDLPVIVAEMEKSAAGVEHQHIKQTGENLKSNLRDAIEIYLTQQIAKEMERQNSKIDSPEEYKLGSRLIDECKQLEN